MRRILCALLLLLVSPAVALALPTIHITFPADNALTNSTTVRGTFTTDVDLSDANNPLPTVRVNGTTFHVAVNRSTLTFTATDVAYNQGANAVTATYTGTDGTASDSLAHGITFDSIAPTITITSPPADPNTTPFASVLVTWTVDDPNATTALFSQGFPVTLTDPNSHSQRVRLSAGSNTIVARATDDAGNSSSDQLTLTRLIVCQDPNFPDTAPNGPQTYTVDRNDDLADPIPDDDICDVRPDLRPPPDPSDPNATPPFVPPTGHCTLRAAIQTANHHPGADRINIGNRIIVLTRQGAGEDAALTGDLDVTEDLRIFGGSRDSAIIDGHKLGDRVFDVAPGVKLQLLRLSVTGGRTAKPAVPPTDPNAAERGGCVRSLGTLETNNMALLNCKSDGAGGALSLAGGGATMTCSIVARSQSKTDGGGIAYDGVPVTLRNSTLSLNSAGVRGGALFGAGDALTLTNVTVSHNRAKLAGGALDLGDGADATLNNCTFTNNSAKIGATISTTGTGSVLVSNSILGDGSRFACDPGSPVPVVSRGGNIDRSESCNLTEPSDLENVDPKLAPLATNVGPPTHALRVGSPAIDHAGTGSVPCEPLDARDVERGDWPPLGEPSTGATASPPFCDSGAFELRTPTP